MIPKNFILGVGVSNTTSQEILEFLLKGLRNGDKKLSVFTPNPEIIVRAYHDNGFRKILNSASLALPDGIGVIWAGKILGKKFEERITGIDTLENLCKIARDYGLTVGLLGGGPKVAEKTAECLVREYPNLRVVFVGEEWSQKVIIDSKSKIESRKSKLESIDILFVAFGAPKQEIWISKNLSRLSVKVAVGVGGAFDYISGRVPRAPKWLQHFGLEWLFRLVIQPWRIRRQVALLEFVYLVLKEKLSLTLRRHAAQRQPRAILRG